MRGPCCRHQKDRVQHPNDQQQRLSLSAARWKETEGTAIDIARQARVVSVSARIGPHALSLSACIGPARIGISRPLSLGPRPLRRTTEDHEFIGSDIDQSTQLVINYKHHRIGSSLPSPNISRGWKGDHSGLIHHHLLDHSTLERIHKTITL